MKYGAMRVATTLPTTAVHPRRRRDRTAGVSDDRGGGVARLAQATALLPRPSYDLVKLPAKPPLRDHTTSNGHGDRRHPDQHLPPHYRPLCQQQRHHSTLRSLAPTPLRGRRRNPSKTLLAPNSVRAGERAVAHNTEAGRCRRLRRRLLHPPAMQRDRDPGAATSSEPLPQYQKETTALVPVADRGHDRTHPESRVAMHLVQWELESRLAPLLYFCVAAK